jgi:hypothetical protein
MKLVLNGRNSKVHNSNPLMPRLLKVARVAARVLLREIDLVVRNSLELRDPSRDLHRVRSVLKLKTAQQNNLKDIQA